MLLQK